METLRKLMHIPKKQSDGQTLVVIALSFVVLLAFIGLAVDGGMVIVRFTELRHAVDAAALSAASNLRDNPTLTEIQAVAEQTMELNGVDPLTIQIDMCGTPAGGDLCVPPPDPPKKLVRVWGEVDAPVAFMQVLGFSSIPLRSFAVAEAASLDVVLVIDVSDSMANLGEEVYGNKTNENPAFCNPEPDPPAGQPCMPFYDVQEAAKGFAAKILDEPMVDEADRVGLVFFSAGWDRAWTAAVPLGTNGWTADLTEVETAIDNLNVFSGYDCSSPAPGANLGKCRNQAGGGFVWECPIVISQGDDSTCQTTNLGGGLLWAAKLFNNSRQEALRVVVLLTDGTNNATSRAAGDCPANLAQDCVPANVVANLPFGYCPQDPANYFKCRDRDVTTRTSPHPVTWSECPMTLYGGSPPANPDCPSSYDADDFAMDVADFLACPEGGGTTNCPSTGGQGAIIFTIGMGPQVTGQVDDNGQPYGAYLLRYIANAGDQGVPLPFIDPDNDGEGIVKFDGPEDNCVGEYANLAAWETNCGNYFFVPDATHLTPAFEAIADRIFTRIVR